MPKWDDTRLIAALFHWVFIQPVKEFISKYKNEICLSEIFGYTAIYFMLIIVGFFFAPLIVPACAIYLIIYFVYSVCNCIKRLFFMFISTMKKPKKIVAVKNKVAGDILVKSHRNLTQVVEEQICQKIEDMDFRVEKVVQGIKESSDFMSCLNDVSGCFETNGQEGISSAVLESYVHKILAKYMEKIYFWNKQLECISFILLSDIVVRNEAQQKKRNEISINFLATDFCAMAHKMGVHQKYLWSKVGFKDIINDIITLLEMDAITRSQSQMFLNKANNSHFVHRKHKILDFILENDAQIVLGKIGRKELEIIVEKMLYENMEDFMKIVNEQPERKSTMVKLVRKIKDSFKNKIKTNIIELSGIVEKCAKDKRDVLLPKKELFVWTDLAKERGYHETYGEGPFELFATLYKTDSSRLHSIKVNNGYVKSFATDLLTPLRLQERLQKV